MIVLYKGSLEVQGTTRKSSTQGIVFQPNQNADEDIQIKTTAADTRFILLAGKPLNEPIANHGPFVLTNEEQLHQAFDDFQHHKNGFENARNWRS